MRYAFYDSVEYQDSQAKRTKQAWKDGQFEAQLAETKNRQCRRKGCKIVFRAKTYDEKVFCSRSCAAFHNNLHRGPLTEAWRRNISLALIGKPNHSKGGKIIPRLEKVCPTCKKIFLTERWRNHKYCGVPCVMKDIGSRPTSPRAARAKSGIRPDISPKIYFFSRWEANFARILNLLQVEWVFQPKVFDLKFQKYTPDFYLPRYKMYVEIKNFMTDYSAKRDAGFRKLYPEEKLLLISKQEYIKLQDDFSRYIENWEFS